MLLGIDVGGTKISGVLLTLDGEQVAAHWENHAARGLDDIVPLIAETARSLLANQGVSMNEASLGISVAGLVDADGRVTLKGDLSLHRDDVAGAVHKHAGVTGRVVNDAEATLRAAIAHDPDGDLTNAALLALGTGVGGAVMWQKRILRGQRGFAGELGHLPVLTALPYRCVCGGVACLEQFASGRGLAERAVAEATAGNAEDLLQFAAVSPDKLTSVHVVEGARAGVPTAVALLDDATKALAQAVIALSVVTELEKVYLGGSLGHAAADQLLPRIQDELASRWPFAATWPPPTLSADAVGRHAAAVGAALLSRETDV